MLPRDSIAIFVLYRPVVDSHAANRNRETDPNNEPKRPCGGSSLPGRAEDS